MAAASTAQTASGSGSPQLSLWSKGDFAELVSQKLKSFEREQQLLHLVLFHEVSILTPMLHRRFNIKCACTSLTSYQRLLADSAQALVTQHIVSAQCRSWNALPGWTEFSAGQGALRCCAANPGLDGAAC